MTPKTVQILAGGSIVVLAGTAAVIHWALFAFVAVTALAGGMLGFAVAWEEWDTDAGPLP